MGRAPDPNGFKGGDLRGLTDKLGYLEDLGVNALYLNPIFTSASNHRYHTYDYFAVDPLLGGDEAFADLIEAAHERGMRVMLDGVFNHTGRGFWPFHHILETGRDSPYRGWFHLDQGRLDAGWPLLAYPPPGTPLEHSATAPGGASRRCPSSTPTTPRRASTCSPSPSTGSASVPTAGGSTSPRRSRTSRSGRSSGSAAEPSGPTPTSSARSGGSRPSGSAATGSTP